MTIDSRPAAARGLAGFLTVAGLVHFLVPTIYEPLIPHALPGSVRGWVLASGAAELACAAAVAGPRTRKLGATLTAVLFVAVFPGNVKMAIDWNRQGTLRATLALARLPLQLPLVWWALRVRRAGPRSGGPRPGTAPRAQVS